MNLKQLFVAVPAALFILGNGVAIAGQTVDVAGTIACVMDKWDEKEPDKGHKLVDAAMRCAIIPNVSALPKFVQDCVGKYEYMPDKSWKGAGTCTDNLKGETRYTRPGRKVRTSKNTRTNIPVAPESTKALVAGARTCMRV
jgi:hypothetical protein